MAHSDFRREEKRKYAGFVLFFSCAFMIAFAASVSVGSSFSSDGVSIISEEDYYELGEQIRFIVCGNVRDNIDVSVSCIDDSDIVNTEWSRGCLLYGFDSQDLDCLDVNIYAREHDSNGKIIHNNSVPIIIGDYGLVLKQSITNDKSIEPLDLAVRAYGYHLSGNITGVDMMVEMLKGMRDNSEKCWPSGKCNLETTVEVLTWLSRADVNRTKRTYHDALLWIESMQADSESAKFNMTVTARQDTSCKIMLDDNIKKTFIVDGNRTFFEKADYYESGSNLKTECDDNFCVAIFDDVLGVPIFKKCLSANGTIHFKMDSGCWSKNLDLSCNTLVSSRALMLSGIGEPVFSSGKEWFESNLIRGAITGERAKRTYAVDSRLFDEGDSWSDPYHFRRISASQSYKDPYDIMTNINLFSMTGNDDVKTWLFYSQNNDGSFADSSQEFVTLEAIRGFLDYSDAEWIYDARKWMLESRPKNGWGDVMKDALFYEIFRKDARVHEIDGLILQSSGERIEIIFDEIVLEHPYNISGDANRNLSGIVNVDAERVDGNSVFRLDFDPDNDGIYSGHLIVFDGVREQRVPFSFVKMPEMRVMFQGEYRVFDEAGAISVPIVKSDSRLVCNFSFNGIMVNETMEIGNQKDIVLRYNAEKLGNYPVAMDMKCRSELGVISQEAFFEVERIKRHPFSFRIDAEAIDESPVILYINNELDQRIDVYVEWSEDAQFFPLPMRFSLEKNEEAQIILYQNEDSLAERVIENTLQISSMDYDVDIPLILFQNLEGHNLVSEQLVIKKKGAVGILGNVIRVDAIFGDNDAELPSKAARILLILSPFGILIASMMYRKRKLLEKELQKNGNVSGKGKQRSEHDSAVDSDEQKGTVDGDGESVPADEEQGAEASGDGPDTTAFYNQTQSIALAEVGIALSRALGNQDDIIRQELMGKGFDEEHVDMAFQKLDSETDVTDTEKGK